MDFSIKLKPKPKHVTWKADVKSPPTHRKCHTCDYNDIARLTRRELIACVLCKEDTCIHCISSGDHCMECSALLYFLRNIFTC